MDTVRLARDLGTVSGLLPDGVTRLRDAPHVFVTAVKAALTYLSFEELPSDEAPPRSIWTDGGRLKDHMERLRRNRLSDTPTTGDEQRNAAVDLLVVE